MGDLVMKKIFSIFIIASLACAAVVSCSKELADPNDKPVKVNPGEEENPGEEGQGEGEQNIPEGMIRLTFSVSSENDTPAESSAAADDTKTSWDKINGHQWSEGDQIRIIWNDGASDGQTEGVDYAIATVNAGSVSANVVDADYYYAVYPADAIYTLSLSEGKIEVEFGRNQSGSFSDANIMVAKTSKAAASLSFKNMTSILKFSTGASCNYTKVTFAANDKTKLNGKVSTTFAEPFAVEKVTTGSNRDLLTVNVTPNETYYLALLPDIDLDNGIGFKVEASSQLTGALSTGTLTMERNKVKNLGTIDNQIHTAWFITEDGTGKGTSWEDAGGPERLVQLIYPTVSRGAGQGLTAAYRLHKSTIYVAAGTYNIQKSNGDEVLAPHYNTGTLSATIKGGYPEGLTGTSTTGQDPAVNKTYFICNQTATTDHVFEVSGTNKVNDFTFDGISFTANTEATETAISGIALNYTSSSTSNLTFKNCIFEGLTSTASSGTYGGAAVYVYSSVAGKTVTFEGCTFEDNTAVRGGAVALCNTGAGGDISFNDCTFSGNVASSNQGGSVYVYASGKATFDGTDFVGDATTVNAANGAAIAIIKNASVTLQNGCSFTNLITSGSGGAIFNHGTLIADGTTFSGCKAKLGGAIHTDGDATIGSSETCSFTNNVVTQNGGAIHFQKTASGSDTPTLSVSNSSFSGNGSDVNAGIKGGGIAATSAAYEFTVANCTFSNLLAVNGGAVHTIGIGSISNSSFSSNDCTENGGAIYNSGTLTLDCCTITGKGKSTALTALLGGGLYNEGSATIQNNSVIEECALIAGDAHKGAGIWTGGAGSLTVNESIFRNNSCGYRGGGLFCEGTASINNSVFSSNHAANGGGIHTAAGSSLTITACSFLGNTATNGAALRTLGASGAIAKLIVFNSLFKDNVPASKTGNNGGAVQLTSNYSYNLIANTTFATTDGTALSTGGGSGDNAPTFYVVSCTFADNNPADFDRNYNKGWFYNNICASADFASSRDNLKKAQYYSIFGSDRFGAGGTTTPAATVTDLGKNCLGTFDTDHYPLNSSYSAHYSEGMTAGDIQALSFTNLSLTSAQLDLLGHDQKGNERNGKIMGAYVETE